MPNFFQRFRSAPQEPAAPKEDFAPRFVALRAKLREQLSSDFRTEENIELCGRIVAQYSRMRIYSERRLLGLVSNGSQVYSEEHRILLMAPTLDAAAAEDLAAYTDRLLQELIEPGSEHEFSLVSLMIVCPQADRRTLNGLHRLNRDLKYADGKLGWSSLRLAVLELDTGAVVTNAMGAPLAEILKKAL